MCLECEKENEMKGIFQVIYLGFVDGDLDSKLIYELLLPFCLY